MNSIPDPSRWVFAIEEHNVPEDRATLVFPKGVPVLLIKSGGRFYAVSNRCAHMACSLAAGTLENETIQCPCHDWRFDIRTGEFLDAREIKIPTYPYRLLDGKIFVSVE